jgi:hypothetical protein
MSQTKLTQFFSRVPKEISEKRKQLLRERLFYSVGRVGFELLRGYCPKCNYELEEITDKKVVRKFCKADSFLYRYHFRALCPNCNRIMVNTKLLGDIFVDLWDVMGKIAEKQQQQRDLKDAKKFELRCPSMNCRKLINPLHYVQADITTIPKGYVIGCYHCGQPILLSNSTWNEKFKHLS